jgi:uroporphyrinogen decarboxylase
MNPRERVLTTLAHKEPDRVPIDLGGTPTGIEVEAYDRLKELLGFNGKTKTFVRNHAEVDEPVLERFGIDTRYLRIKPPRGFKLTIEADNSYLDYWGTRWKKPPSSLYWDMVDYPIKEATLDALNRYQWPDPDDPGHIEGLRERAESLCESTDYALVVDMIGLGVFEHAWTIRGFENFLADLVVSQKFAEALLQRIAEYQVSLWNHVLDEVGEYVQVVMVSDDLGAQNGPMVSPETYRKLIKPVQKKVWQSIKAKTDAFLLLHSCGSVRTFIPDFIELGVDVLNPIQVTAKDMVPGELKSEFGEDISFWGGGCDTQGTLPYGKPDDVEEEVKRRISELAPGGGYVFNQIHNIQPQVPPENIVRMLEAALEHGTYPIST